MIGINEGGVLPHGCAEVFHALETNPDVTLRMAAGLSVWKTNTLHADESWPAAHLRVCR